MRFYTLFPSLLLLLAGLAQVSAHAQKKKRGKGPPEGKPRFENVHFEDLKYRLIGPFRGGRSAAVTGVPTQPTTFYFGSAGGGVWRTHDGGSNWKNISDGFFGGSIGAVAVSEWDPNVIYVGGGEKTIRGNVSHGDGMWKSLDKGKTWTHIGLADSRHIPRIRIHPKNPDLVYVAALGHLYGPNEQRGVFRSKDGGHTWEKVLFPSNQAGAVDLIMDPGNPRILYASTWRVLRTPYSLESGGEGSGLWKSTDGGDTWQNLMDKKGMTKGPVGIVGVAVSPANPERVWAIVEAEKGGVFRSEDGGETWQRINEDRSIRQRAWYYTRIYADPLDADTVYVLNVRFWKSKDGGKSFDSISTPHGDHHDLWIAPEDPRRMVIGDDGGAQVSYDGGESWSTYRNQPTAQFYRVTTDHHFPYRIYGAQQDNSTVRIFHRTEGRSIGERDWEPTAGGESGHIAPNPGYPEVVYGGSYGGFLTRVDHDSGEFRLIDVWPDNPMGHGAADAKYRFQWNFPVFFSAHDANTLYAAANMLFKTHNEGQSWQAISPDLTRDDQSKMGPSGGPITKDNTSVEYYGTIFAATESQHESGVIWCGSDDGLLHLTRDGGGTWENVTPSGLPEWVMINSVEIDPFHSGGLYLAGTRYKLDDFKPYLYKTEDYGKSWKKIVKGIPENHFTRVVRADPDREGLLYAGTESGMYISFDDGENWQPFQRNLPVVPITDLAIKDRDLIVATQGRSFWVLDDLTPLHHINASIASASLHLYPPRVAYRMGGSVAENPGNTGTNLSAGVIVNFYLEEVPEPAPKEEQDDRTSADKPENHGREGADKKAGGADRAAKDQKDKGPFIGLEFLTAEGTLIRKFSTDAKEKRDKLEPKKGLNRFVWNMRYPGPEEFEGMILWNRRTSGPMVAPGDYKVRLSMGEQVRTLDFSVRKDPRSSTSVEDIQKQVDFLIGVREKLSETNRAIERIRKIRQQIDRLTAPMKDKEDQYSDVMEAGEALKKKLAEVEEALYQTKNKSRQDPLNFPIRLNDKLAGVMSGAVGDFPPTDQALEVREILTVAIDAELEKLRAIISDDVAALNQLVASKALPAIWLERKEASRE